MRIFIGCDHAGFRLKNAIGVHLRAQGHEVADLGTFSEERTDYPDQAAPLARSVRDHAGSLGVLVCGSGIGVCITANKVAGVRAASPGGVEGARLSREHNDANVLCLGQRMTSEADGLAMVDAFLSGRFESGRHVARLEKIAAIEHAEAERLLQPSGGRADKGG